MEGSGRALGACCATLQWYLVVLLAYATPVWCAGELNLVGGQLNLPMPLLDRFPHLYAFDDTFALVCYEMITTSNLYCVVMEVSQMLPSCPFERLPRARLGLFPLVAL